MSLSNGFENALLLLWFNNTNIANVGDATGLRGSSAAGSLYLSLHTAWPGEAANQSASECVYSTYAREAVARSGSGFTVSNNQVTLAANVEFGTAGAGDSEVAFFFGVGRESSGATALDAMGVLGSTLGLFTALATDTITIPGLSGLSVGDRIAFFPVPGSSLPTGMTEGTVYFVKTISANDITISTTNGGTAVDLTGAGAGMAFRVTPITIAEGVIPRITTGAPLLTLD